MTIIAAIKREERKIEKELKYLPLRFLPDCRASQVAKKDEGLGSPVQRLNLSS
jgi:hypothetical protein